MGEQELKAALQEETDRQVRQAWATAERQVAERRAEVEARLAQLRELTAQRQAAAIARLRESLLHQARQQAQQVRLLAETGLSERLFRLAGELLPELAECERDELWNQLRQELPELAWARVTVSPADAARASAGLPQAQVSEDAALAGGLVADSADGLIRIDNSLACRLTRAWPDLLPQLLAALSSEVEAHATAAAETCV